MLKAYLNDTKIKDNSSFDGSFIDAQLKVEWTPQTAYENYALYMYDANTKTNKYLNVNIHGNDILSGDVWVMYSPPNPPKGQFHTYILNLYGYNGYIERPSGPINNKIEFEQVALLSSINFQIGNVEFVPLGAAEPYFKADNDLSDKEKRYCRCVIKVSGKGKVNNPYAVCAKSVKTTSRRCGKNYDFQQFNDDELQGYIKLNKIPLPNYMTRESMLNTIYSWKAAKGYM